MTNAEKDWIETTQEFQFRWHEYHDHRYYTKPDDDKVFPKTLIMFIGTNVSHLNFHSNPIKAVPLEPVSASNNMQYQGLMFSLDEFPGHVIVRGCSFENNFFRYDSCLDIDVREKGGSQLLEKPDLKNNFELANRDKSTVYDKAQVKALMNFVNHFTDLGLFNNTFVNNTGLKGIINIDRNPKNETGILLLGNRFVNSSGLIDSNVLNLRT